MNQVNNPTITADKPRSIQQMFNAIAPTYDALNHLLSFGLDIRWRHQAITLLNEKRGGTFLDIAAGSGDISVDLSRLNPRSIVAMDFAFQMFDVFNRKRSNRNLVQTIHFVSADAHTLPFPDGVFDGTIVAFGIRNFTDRLQSLREMHRVLKPSGISIILELTRPRGPVTSRLYDLYSNVGLPLLGKIISKHNSAYGYLPRSIAEFPPQREFLGLMQEAGFQDCAAKPLTFGAATIFSGRKTVNQMLSG